MGNVCVRIKPETRDALEQLAARLHIYADRGYRIGKPSISRLLEYIATYGLEGLVDAKPRHRVE